MSSNSTLKTKSQLTHSNKNAFDQDYKESCFYVWWNAGRVNIAKLYDILPVPLDRPKPSRILVARWLLDWQDRAEFLDKEVQKQLEANIIAEKVAMLEKHAAMGRTLQTIAMAKLLALKDDLKAPDAIRLLVESVRIEKESVGIPASLKAMLTKDDEELMRRINELLDKGSKLESEFDNEYD